MAQTRSHNGHPNRRIKPMSKTQLKKELQQLDKSSIINMVLDLYTARKDARDYLDFFVDPDIDRRIEKARIKIAKELSRGRSGGRSRARISHIRAAINDIATLDPGIEYVADIMVYAIEAAYTSTQPHRLTPTFANGMKRLVADTVTYLDRNNRLAHMLPRLHKADTHLSTRSPLHGHLAEALSQCAGSPTLPTH